MNSKFSIEDAKVFLSQVENGDWEVRGHSYKSYEVGCWKCYHLVKQETTLWVGSGLSHLRFVLNGNEFPIPFTTKCYMWFNGLRKFIKEQEQEKNSKELQDNYLALIKELKDE